LKVPAGTGAVKSLNGNSNGIKNGGGSSQRAQQVATSEPTKVRDLGRNLFRFWSDFFSFTDFFGLFYFFIF